MSCFKNERRVCLIGGTLMRQPIRQLPTGLGNTLQMAPHVLSACPGGECISDVFGPTDDVRPFLGALPGQRGPS